MPEMVGCDGIPSFAFVLPPGPVCANNPASISLSRPVGSVTPDGDTGLPVCVLFDPSTGEVRSIPGDEPQLDEAASGPRAGADSVEVRFSRDISDVAA